MNAPTRWLPKLHTDFNLTRTDVGKLPPKAERERTRAAEKEAARSGVRPASDLPQRAQRTTAARVAKVTDANRGVTDGRDDFKLTKLAQQIKDGGDVRPLDEIKRTLFNTQRPFYDVREPSLGLPANKQTYIWAYPADVSRLYAWDKERDDFVQQFPAKMEHVVRMYNERAEKMGRPKIELKPVALYECYHAGADSLRSRLTKSGFISRLPFKSNAPLDIKWNIFSETEERQNRMVGYKNHGREYLAPHTQAGADGIADRSSLNPLAKAYGEMRHKQEGAKLTADQRLYQYAFRRMRAEIMETTTKMVSITETHPTTGKPVVKGFKLSFTSEQEMLTYFKDTFDVTPKALRRADLQVSNLSDQDRRDLGIPDDPVRRLTKVEELQLRAMRAMRNQVSEGAEIMRLSQVYHDAATQTAAKKDSYKFDMFTGGFVEKIRDADGKVTDDYVLNSGNGPTLTFENMGDPATRQISLYVPPYKDEKGAVVPGRTFTRAGVVHDGNPVVVPYAADEVDFDTQLQGRFSSQVMAGLFSGCTLAELENAGDFHNVHGRAVAGIRMQASLIESMYQEQDEAVKDLMKANGDPALLTLTGYSYNPGISGKNWIDQARPVASQAAYRRSAAGDFFMIASCGGHQFRAYMVGDNLVSYAEGGPPYRDSVHGGDLFAGEDKDTYTSLEPYTHTAGMMERKIAKFPGAKEVFEFDWAQREVQPISFPVTGMSRDTLVVSDEKTGKLLNGLPTWKPGTLTNMAGEVVTFEDHMATQKVAPYGKEDTKRGIDVLDFPTITMTEPLPGRTVPLGPDGGPLRNAQGEVVVNPEMVLADDRGRPVYQMDKIPDPKYPDDFPERYLKKYRLDEDGQRIPITNLGTMTLTARINGVPLTPESLAERMAEVREKLERNNAELRAKDVREGKVPLELTVTDEDCKKVIREEVTYTRTLKRWQADMLSVKSHGSNDVDFDPNGNIRKDYEEIEDDNPSPSALLDRRFYPILCVHNQHSENRPGAQDVRDAAGYHEADQRNVGYSALKGGEGVDPKFPASQRAAVNQFAPEPFGMSTNGLRVEKSVVENAEGTHFTSWQGHKDGATKQAEGTNPDGTKTMGNHTQVPDTIKHIDEENIADIEGLFANIDHAVNRMIAKDVREEFKNLMKPNLDLLGGSGKAGEDIQDGIHIDSALAPTPNPDRSLRNESTVPAAVARFYKDAEGNPVKRRDSLVGVDDLAGRELAGEHVPPEAYARPIERPQPGESDGRDIEGRRMLQNLGFRATKIEDVRNRMAKATLPTPEIAPSQAGYTKRDPRDMAYERKAVPKGTIVPGPEGVRVMREMPEDTARRVEDYKDEVAATRASVKEVIDAVRAGLAASETGPKNLVDAGVELHKVQQRLFRASQNIVDRVRSKEMPGGRTTVLTPRAAGGAAVADAAEALKTIVEATTHAAAGVGLASVTQMLTAPLLALAGAQGVWTSATERKQIESYLGALEANAKILGETQDFMTSVNSTAVAAASAAASALRVAGALDREVLDGTASPAAAAEARATAERLVAAAGGRKIMQSQLDILGQLNRSEMRLHAANKQLYYANRNIAQNAILGTTGAVGAAGAVTSFVDFVEVLKHAKEAVKVAADSHAGEVALTTLGEVAKILSVVYGTGVAIYGAVAAEQSWELKKELDEVVQLLKDNGCDLDSAAFTSIVTEEGFQRSALKSEMAVRLLLSLSGIGTAVVGGLTLGGLIPSGGLSAAGIVPSILMSFTTWFAFNALKSEHRGRTIFNATDPTTGLPLMEFDNFTEIKRAFNKIGSERAALADFRAALGHESHEDPKYEGLMQSKYTKRLDRYLKIIPNHVDRADARRMVANKDSYQLNRNGMLFMQQHSSPEESYLSRAFLIRTDAKLKRMRGDRAAMLDEYNALKGENPLAYYEGKLARTQEDLSIAQANRQELAELPSRTPEQALQMKSLDRSIAEMTATIERLNERAKGLNAIIAAANAAGEEPKVEMDPAMYYNDQLESVQSSRAAVNTELEALRAIDAPTPAQTALIKSLEENLANMDTSIAALTRAVADPAKARKNDLKNMDKGLKNMALSIHSLNEYQDEQTFRALELEELNTAVKNFYPNLDIPGWKKIPEKAREWDDLRIRFIKANGYADSCLSRKELREVQKGIKSELGQEEKTDFIGEKLRDNLEIRWARLLTHQASKVLTHNAGGVFRLAGISLKHTTQNQKLIRDLKDAIGPESHGGPQKQDDLPDPGQTVEEIAAIPGAIVGQSPAIMARTKKIPDRVKPRSLAPESVTTDEEGRLSRDYREQEILDARRDGRPISPEVGGHFNRERGAGSASVTSQRLSAAPSAETDQVWPLPEKKRTGIESLRSRFGGSKTDRSEVAPTEKRHTGLSGLLGRKDSSKSTRKDEDASSTTSSRASFTDRAKSIIPTGIRGFGSSSKGKTKLDAGESEKAGSSVRKPSQIKVAPPSASHLPPQSPTESLSPDHPSSQASYARRMEEDQRQRDLAANASKATGTSGSEWPQRLPEEAKIAWDRRLTAELRALGKTRKEYDDYARTKKATASSSSS